MATSVKKRCGVSGDSSSSSDDEELRKCQEAVWEANVSKTKDEDTKEKSSKRVVVAEHDLDGNELQVTQGFRTHVAKKLGHFLDSCISDAQPAILNQPNLTTSLGDGNDGGFRLFSTSVPGKETRVAAAAPARRRPVQSSSDSDSEMETRLREAAVSVKDLLSAAPPLSYSSGEPQALNDIKEDTFEGEGLSKKKKKKKRQKEDEETQTALKQNNGDSKQECTNAKEKRKKKRKLKPETSPEQYV